MSRTIFLNGLKDALQGELDAIEISKQLSFYEQYIEDEVKKGRREADILEELGSPRLIARTIIETKGSNKSYGSSYYEQREEKENENHSSGTKLMFERSGTFALILGILIVIIVIGFVFSIVTTLAPIVIPLFIISFVISFLRKKS